MLFHRFFYLAVLTGAALIVLASALTRTPQPQPQPQPPTTTTTKDTLTIPAGRQPKRRIAATTRTVTTQRSIHSAIHERVVAQQGEAIRTTLYNSDHKFLSRLTDEMHTFTA